MFLLISENNKLCLFTCIHVLQRLLHIIQIIDRLSIYTKNNIIRSNKISDLITTNISHVIPDPFPRLII